MKRTKETDKIRGFSNIPDMEYNEPAGAIKVLGPIVGKLVPAGAADSERRFEAGVTIAFFNSDTVVHWVAFGATGLAAPTGYADGIPLAPRQFTVLAAGADTAAISDSAGVFAYWVIDESKYVP